MERPSAKKSAPAPRRSGVAKKSAPAPRSSGVAKKAAPSAPPTPPRAAGQTASTTAQVRDAVVTALAEEKRARAARRRKLAFVLAGVVLVTGAVVLTGLAVGEICRHSKQVAATASVAALFVAGSAIWFAYPRRFSR